MTSALERYRLDGRVALVTGGGGLLGRHFARTLAEAGAAVGVLDIRADAAARVAQEIEAQGGRALALVADITDPQQAHDAVHQLVRTFGRLDILVNSAALDPKVSAEGEVRTASAFEDFPLETWRQALDVNLTGTFLITQAAARVMREQNYGVIINLGSTYGLVGPDQRIYQKPGQPPQYKPVYYTVTKAAMLGFTRYLATYYAGTGIRVNTLVPGGVYNHQDPEFVAKYAQRTVMGRMAQAEEIAAALLFLASDASSYMTGAHLVVDGGWTAW
ncbi:MAG: SDR family oxidoreductase [Chloroflexi bacterium]|nr:SDR family oxidoreductase [Chloroflexota bacterium]